MINTYAIKTVCLLELLFTVLGFIIFLATFNWFWAGMGATGNIIQLATLLILIRIDKKSC
jgi:hypothetical protein